MNAILIQSPRPEFDGFLTVCSKLLSHNPSREVDADPRRLSEVERWQGILQGFHDQPNDKPNTHLHTMLSFLVWAPHPILQCFVELCDLPFITAETQDINYTAAIISGTSDRWLDIVKYDRVGLESVVAAVRNQLKRIGL